MQFTNKEVNVKMNIFELVAKINRRINTKLINMNKNYNFKSIGRFCKIRGHQIVVGRNVIVGDFCWIEAVQKYADETFEPQIVLSDEVAMSDFVHISAIKHIEIGEGTLIGSKVYIGDHSHGHYKDDTLRNAEKDIMPINRPLADEDSIFIGKNCWIGDGVVILAGTRIGDNCVVGANSVVKGTFKSNVLIAGLPAKIVKEYK